MNDTRYAPPGASVSDPTIVPAKQRPSQIVLAMLVAAAAYVLGILAVIVPLWDYYTAIQSPLRMLISQAVGLSIYAFLWAKIYRGRNWARIVLLVFTLINILTLANPIILDLFKAASLLVKITMLTTVAMNLVVLCLLFLSPGRAWFRKTPEGK